jgi:membrane-associated protein
MDLIDLVLHLDEHLNDLANAMGPWLYLILFAIIFCETGLIVTPFLPGDSLLFAVGALAAVEGSELSLPLLAVLLIVAAVVGDAVNFWIGFWLGPKVFRSEGSWLLNKRHLLRAQEFYEKHGGKTIILARFLPIVRTFAPFVAGVGRMNYGRFWFYNCTGAVAWVLIFLLGGYYFGNLPAIKGHFHWVIGAIILLSVLPIVIEWLLNRYKKPRVNGTPGATREKEASAVCSSHGDKA